MPRNQPAEHSAAVWPPGHCYCLAVEPRTSQPLALSPQWSNASSTRVGASTTPAALSPLLRPLGASCSPVTVVVTAPARGFNCCDCDLSCCGRGCVCCCCSAAGWRCRCICGNGRLDDRRGCCGGESSSPPSSSSSCCRCSCSWSAGRRCAHSGHVASVCCPAPPHCLLAVGEHQAVGRGADVSADSAGCSAPAPTSLLRESPVSTACRADSNENRPGGDVGRGGGSTAAVLAAPGGRARARSFLLPTLTPVARTQRPMSA